MEPEANDMKKTFFKKVKMSIFNIEKYPELAAEGVPRAISYLFKIVTILAIVICAGLIYQTTQVVEEITKYIESNIPEFSYQDGTLDMKSEEPIKIENETVGTIIIDTKTENKEEINQYENAIVMLKNEIKFKNNELMGTTTYEYSEILGQMGITRFEKQDLLNYIKGTQMISLYISIFVTIFIYTVILYLLNTLINVILVSAFGYLASIFAKVKMRYAAIFNMSVYAITLSIILNIIYIIINTFIDFNIKYFDVMYISVAVIYLFAAIFMLKADLQKKQTEVMKIVEVQEQVKKEMEKQQEEQEKDKQEKEPKEEKKKENNKKNDKKKGEERPQPEGTRA